MTINSERLAIFLPALYAGGAERSMLKLAGGLAARGYAIDLVLANTTGPLMAEVPPGARVVNLGTRRVMASLPALVRYLRRERPATLLSVLHANVIAIIAGRIAGTQTRVVVSERNMLSIGARYYASDLRMRFMPHLARLTYPRAHAVVAVSEGVADDLIDVIGIPRRLVRVIYNPIVTPEFVEKTRALLGHPWFEPGEPPVVLAVGRLRAQKDFGLLIRAFAQIRQERPARLLILGEGEDRPVLEATITEFGLGQDVSLPGYVANPYPYMRQAAVFVLSSRWEGLPGVLIEALYCGVPIVATDCHSGPREILVDGQYGRLVPVGDVEGLAAAMVAALDGRVPRPSAESWQPYELDRVVGQYVDVLFGDKPQQACVSGK